MDDPKTFDMEEITCASTWILVIVRLVLSHDFSVVNLISGAFPPTKSSTEYGIECIIGRHIGKVHESTELRRAGKCSGRRQASRLSRSGKIELFTWPRRRWTRVSVVNLRHPTMDTSTTAQTVTSRSVIQASPAQSNTASSQCGHDLISEGENQTSWHCHGFNKFFQQSFGIIPSPCYGTGQVTRFPCEELAHFGPTYTWIFYGMARLTHESSTEWSDLSMNLPRNGSVGGWVTLWEERRVPQTVRVCRKKVWGEK